MNTPSPLESSSMKTLSSWKEISSYLGVDIKTAQRYETKLGLPVHRREGLLRSRVFAFRDEIDQWQNRNSAIKLKPQKVIWLFRRRLFLAILGVIALAAFSYFIYSHTLRSAQPANFRIDLSTLVILDKFGRDLWPFETHALNLWEENQYRDAFQRKKEISDEIRMLPVIMIKDIDLDGLNEVLFSIQTTDGLKAGILYCLDSHGTELWRFEAGREIQLGSRVYPKDFVIIGVDVSDLNNDGRMEIFLMAHAREEIPTRVVILNVRGDLMGEYWNVGQFNDYAFEDLNSDGRKEILLVGQNNGYDRPCLVVLDSDSMRGISPSRPPLECRDLAKGSEKYYLLFRLTELDRLYEPKVALCKIDLLSSGRIQVRTTFSYVFYELDFELQSQEVVLSDTYKKRYQNAAREGKLGLLDEQKMELIRKELAGGIEYYNGASWGPHHAMSNRW